MSKRGFILRWLEQGVLDQAQAGAALSLAGVLPDSRRWLVFIENLLVGLGGLALAFATLFFIAYNWEVMGRFAKFGLIEVLIVVSLLAYWRLGADKLSGKFTLLVVSLLLGVLLAFYGQTYQTGADTWQLFANWALLILPWVLIGRFAALWVLWLSLLNLSIVLYFLVMPGMFGLLFSSVEHIFWQLFILNSLACLGWEFFSTRFAFLAERWAVRLIATASGVAISILCLYAIFDQQQSYAWVVVAYIAWLGVMYFVYRKQIPDLFMLAGVCLSVIVVVTSFIGRQLLEDSDPVGVFLLMAVLVSGMAAAAAIWLKNVHKEFQS